MSLGYGVAAVAAGLWAYKERRELVAGLPSDEALRAAATFSSRYVAVVTGANRGIGREIVASIAETAAKAGRAATIVLCSRTAAEGEKAAAEIQASLKLVDSSTVHVISCSLDITSPDSVKGLAAFLSSTPELGGRVDVLINNAGFAFKMADETPFPEQATATLKINYWGTKSVCEAVTPFLRKSSLPLGGRVITVSSTAGVLKGESDTTLRFLADHATVADIDALATEFVAAAAKGEHKDKGFSGSAYSVSKSCATHLMRVMDHAERNGRSGGRVRYAAVCPGFCRTGMTSTVKNAMSALFFVAGYVVGQSARAGADTPAYLALCDPKIYEGKFAGRFVRSRMVKPFAS